jgi:hypothetical protein
MSNRWASNGQTPGVLETAAIQAGIDQVMRSVAAERYNPNTVLPPPTVTVANAPKVVTAEEPAAIDLRIPPGQSAIHALADHYLGPGVPPTLASIRAQIQALTPEQRATLLLSPTLRPELRAMLEEAEAKP